MLPAMQIQVKKHGRPLGTKTFDPVSAKAFGDVVRATRTEEGIAQEALAHMAGVDRSHMGKIERGTHTPNLTIILKIAEALGRSAGELILETEARLRRTSP